MAKCFVGAGIVAPGAGGISVVARLSIRALDRLGYSVAGVSLLDKGVVDVEGHKIRGCYGIRSLFAAEALFHSLRSKFVIYDALGVSRAHLGRPVRRPVAAWIHGIEVWEAMPPAYRRALDRVDLVLCNSHFTLQRYQDLHGPLPKAKVCPLATEDDAPPASRASFSGPPVVLILGRIDASEGLKGHAELLAAWPTVVAAVPDARLVIAGGGTGLDKLRQDVARSNVADSIELLGFVDQSMIPALFARAHVFAMPSRQEGFGIAYIEAMRHGVPCIASTHDGGQEVNVDGVTGFNVNLNRADDLPGRMIDLLSDPDLAFRLGQNAYARWLEAYR